MNELGLVSSYWIIVLIWIAKVILLVLVSTLLAWLGIRVMDALTPHIHQRQRIGESPIATGLFIAGFFILVGLVILAISFVISLFIGLSLFHIVNKLTPKIPFASINESPLAAGIYIFGYLVFFGLIIHAALTGPL